MTPDPPPTPPACDAALEYLQRQLDGDAPDLPPAVEAHLEACADCRERFRAAPDLLATLSRLDAPGPPALFTERLIADVRRAGDRRRRLRRWPLAGALAAAVVLAAWLARPRPDTSAPAPAPAAPGLVQDSPRLAGPPELRRRVAEAGEAVAALTQRAAREAVGGGPLALPEVAMPAGLPDWDAALDPAARPLGDARQGLAEGFEPVATSARRAVRLFLRDLPLTDDSRD
jgi:hypothetical protein